MILTDFFNNIKDSYKTFDPYYLQNYSINGIPLISYMAIGATTILLAAVTVAETSDNIIPTGESIQSNVDLLTDKLTDSYESLTNNLPSFSEYNNQSPNNENMMETIQSIPEKIENNLFNNPENSEKVGGNIKKNHSKKNKIKNQTKYIKNKKTYKK